MSKAAKVWLIIAGSLVALGVLIFVGALAISGWDLSNFGISKYTTQTYEIGDSFDTIVINVPASDIEFAPANDGKCRIDCFDLPETQYSAEVRDDALTVTTYGEKTTWIDRLSAFSCEGPKMTVYLPESVSKQLKIAASAGDVRLPADFTFDGVDIDSSTSDVDCAASVTEEMKIHSTTGDIRLSALSAGKIHIDVTTGDVQMQNVTAQGDVTVKTTTGDITLTETFSEKSFSLEGVTCDIRFDKCDAAQIAAHTTTGDITGTLCSDKNFTAKSNVGDVKVPDNGEGGNCELTTGTGNILITIVEGELPKSTADSTAQEQPAA